MAGATMWSRKRRSGRRPSRHRGITKRRPEALPPRSGFCSTNRRLPERRDERPLRSRQTSRWTKPPVGGSFPRPLGRDDHGASRARTRTGSSARSLVNGRVRSSDEPGPRGWGRRAAWPRRTHGPLAPPAGPRTLAELAARRRRCPPDLPPMSAGGGHWTRHVALVLGHRRLTQPASGIPPRRFQATRVDGLVEVYPAATRLHQFPRI